MSPYFISLGQELTTDYGQELTTLALASPNPNPNPNPSPNPSPSPLSLNEPSFYSARSSLPTIATPS